MTTASQLSEILSTLESMERLDIHVTTTENSIYVINSGGKVISNAMTTAEELNGWVSCFKDFKGVCMANVQFLTDEFNKAYAKACVTSSIQDAGMLSYSADS